VDAAVSAFYAPREKFRLTRPADLHLEIGRVTGEATFALFKNAARIQHVRDELARIERDLAPKVYAPDLHELIKAHDGRTYLEVCKLVTRAMLERTESRAELFRVDYPFRDNDRWLKWVMVRAPGEDLALDPVISQWELPFARWPIQPPRGREPSTYRVPERFREAQAA
jgi:succinate dehydrogenase / fumarate reductase, flavoprotein subunit